MLSNKLDSVEQKNNVKALLVRAGLKQCDIARKLRLKPSTISEVVAGKKMSARVRRAIARALGVRVSDLWPERKAA